MWSTITLLALVQIAVSTTYIIPNEITLNPVSVQFNSGTKLLDGQKILPRPNDLTYEWWYFDVVSTSSANESITIVFFESTSTGFPYVLPGSSLSVVLFASFEDGTWFTLPLVNAVGYLGAAVITETTTDVSGVWQSTGASFAGSNSQTHYTVTINAPLLGIQGSLNMTASAPAHYPCGPSGPNSNEVVTPHIGWANAIPDADATVDFTIGTKSLSFTGLGYHDKNWGDAPFALQLNTWYWGHARLGPYSIVWFDVLHPNGSEYLSAYASKNGNIVAASCTPTSVKVRPAGQNSLYPPTLVSGKPEKFSIIMDLGAEGILNATATNRLVIADAVSYIRYLGSVSGTVGGNTYTGTGLWEEFRYNIV